MLRFDPSGAVHPEYGVTGEQLKAIYPRLSALRYELIEAEPQHDANGQTPSSDVRLDTSFYGLPKQQLDAYRQFRESSPLGRVFKVANSQMDMVDAVVVVGAGGCYAGPLAIMDACCDPYHNELRRGPRGGKPRMYFAGYHFDNDAAQSLLSRIGAGGYGDTDVDMRWALVVNSKGGETLEMAASFRQLLAALQLNLKRDDLKLLPRLVVPVTGAAGRLHDLVTAMGCEEIFFVPDGVNGRFSVLSPVGLLPAAMLGHDIVKLLEGAVAMNQHFESAPADKNVILQYVAINHLIEKHQGKTIRALSVWSQALASVGKWHEQLLAGSNGKLGLGATPLTIINPSDLHGRHQQHQHGRNDKIFHNLIVEQVRTDPLPVGTSEHNHDLLDDLAEMDLPDILATALRSTNETLHTEGRPTTNIVLPTINTYVLGQLFQMLMIATVLESRLLDNNPYDQPAIEQYKTNLAFNLGRN